MRKVFLLSIILTAGYGYAQSTTDLNLLMDVNTTLIDNQLSPEIGKLEYAGGLTKGLFKAGDGKLLNKFQQNILTASAFPWTLINNRHEQVFLGVGYVDQHFSDFSNQFYDSLFSENIRSIYLGTALSLRITHQLFWLSYVQTGFNGTKPLDHLDKTFNAVFITKGDYKPRRNLNIGLGIAYFTNMGSPLILPAVSLIYSRPDFVLNIDFPVKTEIEAVVAHGKIRPVAGVSYHGGNYYLNASHRYLYNYGALGYLGVRFKLLDLVYFYVAYQEGLYDQYKSGLRQNLAEIGTYAGQSQFVISLNVQVAKFIPRMQR